MVALRVLGSLLLAMFGVGVLGYAILVAGQLFLGLLGFIACVGVAALVVSGRR